MNKSLLSVPLLFGALTAAAQSGGTAGRQDFAGYTKAHAPSTQMTPPRPMGANVAALRVNPFWTEDFSGGGVPSGWTNVDVQTPVGTPNVTFVWSNDPTSVGVAALGYTPSATFGASSASNGYLWANSDRGLSAAPPSDALTQLTTTAIDCSTQPTVLLTMESLVGVFDYDANTNVRVNVSTDGSNWTTFIPFPCLVTGSAAPPCSRWSANPQGVALDISSVAANQATVYLRFEWLGGWEYFWAIDDIALSPVPDYELVTDYGVLSHTGTGEEYGRTPIPQLKPQFNLGAQARNAGANAQNNVVLSGEVRDASNTLVFSATAAPVALPPSDTATMNEFVNLPTLTEGVYTGTFTVTSDEIANDEDPANNTVLRTFELNNLTYSLDGIGVHLGTPSTSSLGTASFTSSADGAYFMTYYPVRTTMGVYAMDVLITSGTSAGAVIIASIHDSTTVLGGDVNSPFIESLDYVVSAADVTAGVARVPFYGGIDLQPGAYYAAVQLFSNGNTTDVQVVDDNTVPQPNLASIIYLPDEADPGPYTNGNAMGLRLVLDPAAGITENEIAGVNMYPNPTDGLLQVTVDQTKPVDITVMNALGKVVSTGRFVGRTTIDLAPLASGIYTIRLTDGTATTTQRVARR